MAAAAAKMGWAAVETDWSSWSPATTSSSSTSARPGDTPRRDRDRRARGRQARAVREAARQHRRRRRRRWPRPPARAEARGVRSMVGLQLPPRPGGGPGPRRLVAEGRLGADPARARAVPAGLDRRPGVPAGVAAAARSKAGSGALGDIGAHIVDLAQYVTGAADHRGLRADGDVRHGAPAAGGVGRAGRLRRRRRHRRRSRSTTRRCSSARFDSRRARRRSRPPGSRPAARTRMRLEVNGSEGSLAFDFESMNELPFHDGTEDPDDRGLPPDPGDRAHPPVRRRLVAARARPRLRAHLHPRGRRPGARDRATDRARGRRSPTGCRCSGCSPPSSARPPTTAAGAVAVAERRASSRPTPARRHCDDPTDHAVHRPVGRPAVRRDVPAGLRVGLRRPRDRLLGRPPRRRQARRGRRLRRAAAATCSRSTT